MWKIRGYYIVSWREQLDGREKTEDVMLKYMYTEPKKKSLHLYHYVYSHQIQLPKYL